MINDTADDGESERSNAGNATQRECTASIGGKGGNGRRDGGGRGVTSVDGGRNRGGKRWGGGGDGGNSDNGGSTHVEYGVVDEVVVRRSMRGRESKCRQRKCE